MASIFRYTPENQKALGLNVKSEPWLHVMVDFMVKSTDYVIYVWDTREVIDEGNVKLTFKHNHLLQDFAQDNLEQLVNVKKQGAKFNTILANLKQCSTKGIQVLEKFLPEIKDSNRYIKTIDTPAFSQVRINMSSYPEDTYTAWAFRYHRTIVKPYKPKIDGMHSILNTEDGIRFDVYSQVSENSITSKFAKALGLKTVETGLIWKK